MFRTKTIRNLLLGSLFCNFLGDTDVFFYIRFFVPMGDRITDAFTRVNLAGMVMFYSVGFIVPYIYIKPVDNFLAMGRPAELSEMARRRTLNFPVVATGCWAALWFFGGPFFYIGLRYFSEVPMEASVIAHVSMIVILGGTVVAVFIYFFLEWAVRKWLVELVFATDPVCSQPGVYKVGIKTKMKLYYFAAVVMPLVIIGASIYMGIVEVESTDSHAAGLRLIFLTMTLCGWGIMVGYIFAVLIGWDVTTPIMELESAMEVVENGSLDVSMPVLSTDEIGKVREGFNEMVRGLRERDFIKETFGRYVTKQVSEAVLNGRLRLGGELRDVTILFCDIRNFTAMSEKMPPEQVIEFLNGFFSEMVDVVIESNGTLDKFIGDAFLAVYGAPLEMEDHALNAARAAVEMRKVLDRFNIERAENNLPPIGIGISIHSGKVVAGNIGSQKRMEYTVIGDTVNLASRIEGLNRHFGTDILISEDTYRRLQGKVQAKPMQPVPVKGKSEMVQVYSLESLA